MKKRHKKAVEAIIDDRIARREDDDLTEEEKAKIEEDILKIIERYDSLRSNAKKDTIEAVKAGVGVAGVGVSIGGIVTKIMEIRRDADGQKLDLTFKALMAQFVSELEKDNIIKTIVGKNFTSLLTKFK